MPLVLGVATVVFLLLEAAPGDPFVDPRLPPQVRASLRETFGLDQPLHLRYLRWLGAFFTGNFGYSYSYLAPVRSVLASVLPNTLLLAACALVLAFVAGVALGTLQAVRQNGLVDSVLSVVLLFFYSMPSFWLALMLILVFSLMARNVWEWGWWLPGSGIRSADHAFLSLPEKVLDRVRHLVLPTLSLALVLTAGVARYTRAGMLEVVRQDYVRTARAKGLPERTVIVKHALRNGLLPVITLLGLYLPLLLSGAVFVEYVFAWPGMGRTMVEAISARDYPLVMAGSALFAGMVVVGNLVADLLYAAADPRIRHG